MRTSKPTVKFSKGHGWFIYRTRMGVRINTPHEYLLQNGKWNAVCGVLGYWQTRVEATVFLKSQKV